MAARSGGGRTSVAGASARAHYRALWREHRMERMIVCAVLSAVSGTGAAAASGWRVGALVAAAAVPLYYVYAWIRPGPATRWRRGAAAERRTGRHLSRLDPAGYYVLHDRALPDAHPPGPAGADPASRPGRGAGAGRAGRVANLDHLVIGLTGVYAIVTRRWRPRAGIWLERRRLLVGGRSAAGPLRTAVHAAEAVSAVLRAELDFDVPVSGVVAVYGARVPRVGLLYEQVVFQRADRLPSFVRDHPVVFTSAQVAEMAAAAERRLPPMIDRPA